MTQFHGTIQGKPLTEEQKKARRKDIPAFPVNKYEGSWIDGMNLRDYFAAKALQGLLNEAYADYNDEAITELAYSLANCMMKAREE